MSDPTKTETGFKTYCIGHAAENKPRETNQLKIFPTEITPFVDGELNADAQEMVAKGVDKDGNAYELKGVRKTYLTAEWYRGDSNRDNAPDIQRGEKIRVYRYADTDHFYWTTMGEEEDMNRRRLETLSFSLSNMRESVDRELTDDEKWLISASTHDKHITIKTTKSDGEPYAYTLQLNLKDGQFVITDDVGNMMHINSAENEVLLQNADGSFFQVIKHVINVFAKDEVNVKTKRYTLEAEESITMETKATTLSSSETIDVETTTTNWSSSDSFTATTVTFTIDGKLVTTGTSALNGAVTMGAGFASTGGSGGTVDGGVKITGGLTVDDKDLGPGHTHKNGGAGPVN